MRTNTDIRAICELCTIIPGCRNMYLSNGTPSGQRGRHDPPCMSMPMSRSSHVGSHLTAAGPQTVLDIYYSTPRQAPVLSYKTTK